MENENRKRGTRAIGIATEYTPASVAMFPLGQLYVTPAVSERFTVYDVDGALENHQRGIWGDLEMAGWKANNRALKSSLQLLSAHRGYMTHVKDLFWIVTEADRSRTTVMLPSEY